MIYAKAVAALLILATIAAAILAYGHKRYEAGRAEVKAEWDAETARLTRQALEQSEQNRQLEARRDVRTSEIAIQDQQRKQKLQADADRARSSADSLRQQLAALSASAASTAADTTRSADAISTLARQLGECSGQLQEVAIRADTASVQVTALQEFVKAEREH